MSRVVSIPDPCLSASTRQPTLSVSSSLVCSSSVLSNVSQLTSSASPAELPLSSSAPSASSSCRLRAVAGATTETVEALETRLSASLSTISSPGLDTLSLGPVSSGMDESPSGPTQVSSVSAGGSDRRTVTMESRVILGVSASASSGEAGGAGAAAGARAAAGAALAAAAGGDGNSCLFCSSAGAVSMAVMGDWVGETEVIRVLTGATPSVLGRAFPHQSRPCGTDVGNCRYTS